MQEEREKEAKDTSQRSRQKIEERRIEISINAGRAFQAVEEGTAKRGNFEEIKSYLLEEIETDDEIEVLPRVFYGGTERFDRQKIEARKKLLEMPPEKAQEIVDRVLYPQNWEVDESSFGWEESIETSY